MIATQISKLIDVFAADDSFFCDDLIADLDPLSWALPHAAIAGFYLFLSGLITGYFDNRAAYADIGGITPGKPLAIKPNE